MNIFSCRRGKKRKEEEENPKNTHVEIESRESFSSLTQAIEKRIFRESFAALQFSSAHFQLRRQSVWIALKTAPEEEREKKNL